MDVAPVIAATDANGNLPVHNISLHTPVQWYQTPP